MSVCLDSRVPFEVLLADLSARFVNLAGDQVDDAVAAAQQRVVEALDLGRSAVFELADAEGGLTLTHHWSGPGWPPPPARLPASADAPETRAAILAGDVSAFASAEELTSPDRESSPLGTTSSVTMPLAVDGRVFGVVTFSALTGEHRWPSELVTRLHLVAQVFANALSRKRADEELRRALAEVQRLRDQLRAEKEYLRREAGALRGSFPIVGASDGFRHALDQVRQVAPTPATVLLQGETGTGKELFATKIHQLSPRRDRMMVRVNCAAIPSALIESELFGREKGAYTGALARQAGRFEVADKSTLFLDEIGELPLEVQVKLLRVLQERQIERLGSSRSIHVDVRIVAATNRDLEKAIAQGTFREDLYYRLNVFPIRVPPLRERPEDIPLLVWGFVDEFSKTFGRQIESVPKDNMVALQRYAWPGNVRELRNVVERAVIVATGPRLTIDLPKASSAAMATRPSIALVDIERDHIHAVLERVQWRVRGVAGAADLLAMKPSTLESRMAKLGIQRPPR